jgi:hypothetical protein
MSEEIKSIKSSKWRLIMVLMFVIGACLFMYGFTDTHRSFTSASLSVLGTGGGISLSSTWSLVARIYMIAGTMMMGIPIAMRFIW